MAFASSIIPPTTAHGEKAEKFIRTNFKRWQQKMLFYLTTLNLARVYIKLGIILNSYASSQRSSLRHVSGSFRRNSIALYKKAAKFSQQKADFATLWSDLLAMAVTSSFQLRIAHGLKHWILDFLSFEMCYYHTKVIVVSWEMIVNKPKAPK
uniref:Uncharacterized protein n=1 Tax=Vitis vinifera TaxID=29760 RepID=A5ANZ1_VITVI|nr:hypothetical protein VITISV_032466 [Vitis vinifera]